MMSPPEEGTRLLAGRRALITGASRRIGRELALALARAGVATALQFRSDEAGARETAAQIQTIGSGPARDVPLLQADLADAARCARLAREAHDALGGLDILVNNAAIFERAPLEAMTPTDFDRHMAVNARSVYVLTLEAGQRMRRETGGDIINLACTSALRPYPAYIPYSASKAAVVNLTRGFAQALAPTVRVNAIAPGPILPAEGGAPGQGERAVERTLLKRWGTPADIAHAMLFLLRASYVTGYTLAVDGGRSSL